MTILRSPFSVATLLMSLVLPYAAPVFPNQALSQQPLPAEGDESQLIAVLNSDAELFDKAKACQRLAIIGTSESVPVVAKLLADPDLSHYARFALEANPSSDVDKAFRSALEKLKGRQLVGVINSVAARKDTLAVDALLSAADSDDDEVAAAALSALGALGSPESIAAVQQALSGKASLRVAAADACLTAADNLLLEGNNADALKVLAALRSAELPKHINVASRFGEIRAGSENVNELMISYLGDDDLDLFRIGLELAHSLTNTSTTEQLVNQLDSLQPDRQILLLHVLGERGDASALPTVIEALGSGDADMKNAAVRVLGALGNGSVVPVLLKAAVSDDEVLATNARDSLTVLGGDDVDAQLAQTLEGSDGQQRLVLVDVAGRRGIPQVIPLLLQYVSADDAELRNSAIDGLGMTVGLENFPPLVDKMLAMGDSESAKPMKEALRKACQRMGDRDAASKVLLDRMAGESAAAKIELMDLLIYVGGEQALSGVQRAAEGDEDSAADAATQALGKWLTPDAAPVLLELAQSGNEKFRVRCLRGYIRIIRQFGLKPGQRLQMSKQAFAAATRDEERKLVLDTLTRFPSPQGLKMVMLHLTTPSLSEDASKAAVTIGEKIVDNDPKSVAGAMPIVVATTKNEELANRAKVLITRSTSE
ncbi:HEAT repeat domain-containing protein [Novipirellula artificiosorum]|uniref:HEAT repeat protein n=1 Tax=Novipirellula artificiosorum TaxID=2528016 RepID=A0A5C6DLH7_9BACT|nr:HEAT repeat domain-containing protein [Novipirellula artificiosorum]TWU38253.1 HEAT repeat protein [Novipirellula artificiosorum]